MAQDSFFDSARERAKAFMRRPTGPAGVARRPAVGHKPAAKPPAPQKLEIYYDQAAKRFWTKNTRGEWLDLNDAGLKRVLKSQGFRSDLFENSLLSPIEEEIMRIQLGQDVHFAGSLAGYPIGPHTIQNSRVLITRAGNPVRWEKGDCRVVRHFFGELLGEQAVYFFGWLRSAVKALFAGPPFRPGQVLALAGPAGCGKSLCQSLITEILGGRVAKPYRYLIGETPFNSDLFEAEHLAIEDEAASTKMEVRKHFGAQLKNLLVNEVQSYHAKGRPALSLVPFWRVSLSLNDEAESLMVLPPLTDDLKDKFFLLQAYRVNFPYSPDDLAARKAYRETLSKQLPAFLGWLREWRIPERLKDQRYGIKAWQNPDLTRALEELSPESRLLELVDLTAQQKPAWLPWEGTVAELRKVLEETSGERRVAEVFTWHGAGGQYLKRLCKRFPERFELAGKSHNTLVYRIKR